MGTGAIAAAAAAAAAAAGMGARGRRMEGEEGREGQEKQDVFLVAADREAAAAAAAEEKMAAEVKMQALGIMLKKTKTKRILICVIPALRNHHGALFHHKQYSFQL